jgi:hypothetical protein
MLSLSHYVFTSFSTTYKTGQLLEDLLVVHECGQCRVRHPHHQYFLQMVSHQFNTTRNTTSHCCLELCLGGCCLVRHLVHSYILYRPFFAAIIIIIVFYYLTITFLYILAI